MENQIEINDEISRKFSECAELIAASEMDQLFIEQAVINLMQANFWATKGIQRQARQQAQKGTNG